MTIHFGDSTSIATATGLGANLVNAAFTSSTAAQSYSNIGEGAFTSNVLSISYAAASSSNKLLMIAQVTIGTNTSGLCARYVINGSPPSGAIADAHGSAKRTTSMETQKFNSNNTSIHLQYVHQSLSTSSVTYGIQLAHMDNNSRTMCVNKSIDSYTNAWHGRAMSHFLLLEFK
tara:strand:- start:1273 stop:1794 length:522 start_codon:yes stop_codon:yes gene_type:complete